MKRRKRVSPATKARRKFEYTLITRKGPITDGIPKNFCPLGHPAHLEPEMHSVTRDRSFSTTVWGLYCDTCKDFVNHYAPANTA